MTITSKYISYSFQILICNFVAEDVLPTNRNVDDDVH